MKYVDVASSDSLGEWGTFTRMYPYTDNLRGVSYKRSCTDCYCLILFFVFIACWLAIGYYAYWNGDINRLYNPTDSFGRTCGIDDDVKNSPYLFFFDITKCVSLSVLIFGCLDTNQICVSECPKETWYFHKAIKEDVIDNYINWRGIQEKLICVNKHIAKTVNSRERLQKVIKEEACASYYITSTSTFRLCLPNPLGDIRGRSEESLGIVEATLKTQNYFNYVYDIYGFYYSFTASLSRLEMIPAGELKLKSIVGEEKPKVRGLVFSIKGKHSFSFVYLIIIGFMSDRERYQCEVSTSMKSDLTKCWHLLLFFTATAIASCIFIILIMGVVTRIFVWVVLWLVLLLLLCSTVITYMQYNSIPSSTPPMSRPRILDVSSNFTLSSKFYSETLYGKLHSISQQKDTWLYLFIASVIIFSLYFLLIVFLQSRIGIAVMLIGEGSKAINTVKSTLCFPLVTRVLQLGIVIWFFLIFIYIKSLGNSVYKVQGLTNDTDCQCRNYKENDWCLQEHFNDQCTSQSQGGACIMAGCIFSEFRSPKMEFYFLLYNFFGLLWGLFFVAGLNQMILSSCFATWYWTYKKSDVPFFTLTYSLFIVIRYHLGTIALGSFLIASCGFIRAILKRVQRMVKHTDNLVSQFIMWSMRCCFWVLEKFLIFISNNAYIMCAVIGKGFFGSASEVFGLLTRNVVRVVVLDKVMDFIMLTGKFAITFVLTTIAFFSFSSSTLGLNYPWVPTGVVAVVTWLISSSFFGVYSVAVDTLFLSFLKDVELNNGSQHKPYYMSQQLKYILKEKAK